MSLSEAIIYGTLEDIQSYISHGVKLDEIDEYGYSPLVQTAIMNDEKKAELIVKAGADINFPDLTGRTALHWAADNNNEKLCKLLLKNNANANAYTISGQPVLVMPFLRNQKNVKNLLKKHGANLNFAQDFINAKLFGHRYELTEQVDIVDNTDTFVEIDFEGFYLEFTTALILSSLLRFKHHFAGRGMRPYFDKLNKIIFSFNIANELIKYQHYNINQQDHDNLINQLLDYHLLLIPVAFEGHAITFIKYGPFFARCDRGEYGREHGSVTIYAINNPYAFTKQLIKSLLYTAQPREFIREGIEELLSLTPITTLPLSLQITGNCSWANVEAAVPTMMFLQLLKEHMDHLSSNIDTLKQFSLSIYEEWLDWDKTTALQQFVQTFNHSSTARRASKILILAAVFFQSCNNDNLHDLEKLRIILPLLKMKEYSYVLKSYIDVFCKEQTAEAGKKLMDMLDDFGIDVNRL